MIVGDLEAISDGPAFDTISKVSTAVSNYNTLWLWSIDSEIMIIGFGGGLDIMILIKSIGLSWTIS